MPTTNLAAIVTTDLTAITRGRFLPADQVAGAKAGVGWVPANLALGADGIIPADNPWGTAGDLRLLPDPKARYVTCGTGVMGASGATAPFDMSMGDLVTPGGEAWDGCARAQLRAAQVALEEATGLRVMAAFEHEFQILGDALAPAHVFSYQAMRRLEPFAGRYFGALEEAGIEPETILPESGAQQFEITSRPADAMTAADRAVATREITREMCRSAGLAVSFAPVTAPEQAGNGVHVHFSLVDSDGAPAGFDPAGSGGLSRRGGAFCAGIVAHMPEMLAFTAPTAASFVRLMQREWTPRWAWLAEADRGASLRICPVPAMGAHDAAAQFNIEYRATDATANPYLVLAALIRAGLDGIRRDLVPAPVRGDPGRLSPSERAAHGIRPLPATLDEALDRMQSSETVKGWFPDMLVRSFVAIKRAECRAADGQNEKDLCADAVMRY